MENDKDEIPETVQQELPIRVYPAWQQQILNYYHGKFSISPLNDYFRQLKLLGLEVTPQNIFQYNYETQDWDIHPTFNLTGLFIPDMVVRYANEGNATFSLHGGRGSYKSTLARVIAHISAFIAGRRWVMEGHIVDNNTDWLNTITQDLPLFDTVILDEQDITMAGMGTYTMFSMSLDIENRIRARQINLCWCHPQKRDYHVSDYYLQTYGASRDKRQMRALIYNSGYELMGAIMFPMPPDHDFTEYKGGMKKEFLDRTQTLEDPVIMRIHQIVDELAKDPDYPPYDRNKEKRILYIADNYPDARTENMRKRIENLSRD